MTEATTPTIVYVGDLCRMVELSFEGVFLCLQADSRSRDSRLRLGLRLPTRDCDVCCTKRLAAQSSHPAPPVRSACVTLTYSTRIYSGLYQAARVRVFVRLPPTVHDHITRAQSTHGHSVHGKFTTKTHSKLARCASARTS